MSYDETFDAASATNFLNGGEFDFNGFRQSSSFGSDNYDVNDSYLNSGSDQFVYDPNFEPDFSFFDSPPQDYVFDRPSSFAADAGMSLSPATTPSMSHSSTSPYHQPSASPMPDSAAYPHICEVQDDADIAAIDSAPLGEDEDLFGEDPEVEQPSAETYLPSFIVSPGGLTLPSTPMAFGNQSASNNTSSSVANSRLTMPKIPRSANKLTMPAMPPQASFQPNSASARNDLAAPPVMYQQGYENQNVNSGFAQIGNESVQNGVWNYDYNEFPQDFIPTSVNSTSDFNRTTSQNLHTRRQNVNVRHQASAPQGSFNQNIDFSVNNNTYEQNYPTPSVQPVRETARNSAFRGMNGDAQTVQPTPVNSATRERNVPTPAARRQNPVTPPQQASVPRNNVRISATQARRQNSVSTTPDAQPEIEYRYAGLGQPVQQIIRGAHRNGISAGNVSTAQPQNIQAAQHHRGNAPQASAANSRNIHARPAPYNPAQAFAESSAMHNAAANNIQRPVQTPRTPQRFGPSPTQAPNMQQQRPGSTNIPQFQTPTVHTPPPPPAAPSSRRKPRAPPAAKKNQANASANSFNDEVATDDFDIVGTTTSASRSTRTTPAPTRKRARAVSIVDDDDEEVEELPPAKKKKPATASSSRSKPATEISGNTPIGEDSNGLNPYMNGYLQGLKRAHQLDIARKEAHKAKVAAEAEAKAKAGSITLDNIIWEYCHADMPIEPTRKLHHSNSMYNPGQVYCEVMSTFVETGGSSMCQLDIEARTTSEESRWDLMDRWTMSNVMDGREEMVDAATERLVKFGWSVQDINDNLTMVLH